MKLFHNILYILNMIYEYDKKRLSYLIALSLISAIKNFINVFLIKCILDCIANYHSFRFLLVLIVGERIVSSIISYIECLLQWEKCPISDNIIKDKLLRKLYAKSLDVELEKLDNPSFYDKFQRAINEAEQRPFLVISTIERFLGSLLTISSITTMLLFLDKMIILLAFLSAVISLLVNMIVSKYKFRKDKEMTSAIRKIEYVRRLFYLPTYAEEIKTNSYNGLLFVKLDKGVDEYNAKLKNYQSRIALFEVIRNWQIFAINFGILSFLIAKKIVKGIIHVDSFTSILFASTTLSEALSDIFSIIPQLVEHSMFIDNLKEIMEYTSVMAITKELQSVQKGKGHSIKIEQVSFRYHSSEKEVLRNISLHIKKGEKIALVGKNGAGKSTLAKLILRLYDPQEGHLYFDETAYTAFDVKSLREEIAVVYQDHPSFAFSIGENILCRELESQKDEKMVWNSLKLSGLSSKIATLPEKLDTPLSNEFEENGINLSGGESQKLAMAKAICKDAGVLIMDEPSSSLDPFSEYEMYSRMSDMCSDRTVILISHQLYSTKMVDTIYFLEDGAIIESGSHEELMRQDGKYANLYRIQAEQYQ